MKLLVAFLFSMAVLHHKCAAQKTIADRLDEFGDVVRQRLESQFRAAGVPYPPQAVTLIGIKHERVLEVYAADADGALRFVCTYPVLAASGLLGPKLREGDRQVPEGIYNVRELNPNSLFHLSIWLDYPNEFDRARGAEDGRTNLGGEIMIHGDVQSKGCLAMGDSAAEDLFVLAAITGIDRVKVILTPVDFRQHPSHEAAAGLPHWTADLYAQIKRELAAYQVSSR